MSIGHEPEGHLRDSIRPPPRVVILALTVALALTIAGLGLARSRASRSGVAQQPTMRLIATTTTLDPTGGDVVDRATRVRIHVPAGALNQPGTFTVKEQAAPGDLGDALTAVGSIVDISLRGARLIGAVDVILPITDTSAFDNVTLPDGTGAPGTASFVVAHWSGGRAPELLTPTIDRNAMQATVRTRSLSPFGLFRIKTNFAVDLATSLLRELTHGIYTDVPEPRCSANDSSRAWTATPADNPVSWCADGNADSGQHLQVANRRRYAVDVHTDATGGSARGSTTDLAAQLSSLVGSGGTLVLAPGDVANVTLPAGTVHAAITVEYDGLAQALTSLFVAADILSEFGAHVPFAKVKTAKQFLQVLDIAGCVRSLGIRIDSSILNPAGTIAKLVVNCFGSGIAKSGSLLAIVLGGVVGVIAGVIAYFISSGQALFDLIIGGANGTLAFDLSALPRNQTTTPASPGNGSGAWPTLDNEGPPVFYAYMGAEFFFPDWASCSTGYCIAGDGDDVRLYRLQGVEDLGSIPLSTANPRATFIKAGIPPADVDAFMRPGPPAG